jgi:hypothetical protein
MTKPRPAPSFFILPRPAPPRPAKIGPRPDSSPRFGLCTTPR